MNNTDNDVDKHYFFWLGEIGEQFDITKGEGFKIAPCKNYGKDFPKDDEASETSDVGNVDETDNAGVLRTLGINKGIDVA